MRYEAPLSGARLWLLRCTRALTENEATTDSEAADPRLRGRTYGVPFQEVWTLAKRLADAGLRGWSLVEADDQEGRIVAEARTRRLEFVDDVEIRVTLDDDAQTRVEMTSRSRVGRADLGANARRIHRFFRRLDHEMGASRSRAGRSRGSE